MNKNILNKVISLLSYNIIVDIIYRELRDLEKLINK